MDSICIGLVIEKLKYLAWLKRYNEASGSARFLDFSFESAA
jgi:hypothetical protein